MLLKILLFAGLVLILLLGLTYLSRSKRERGRTRVYTPQNLMDGRQARAVLGLSTGPVTADEVIAAHRRLMQRVHPDKGGSEVLAQQLNEAKQVLLKELS